MKKIISLILFLLCVCATYAISYASPYKGSVSRHSARTMHTSGITSMPTASMGSVSAGMMSSGSSSNSQRGINYSTTGFATCATSIRGGVTSTQTYASMAPRNAAPRKTPGYDEDADECPYCHDEDNDGYCDICGCVMGDVNEDGECACADEVGYCWCPLDFDWTVMAFFMALTCAYAMHKTYKRKSIQSVA